MTEKTRPDADEVVVVKPFHDRAPGWPAPGGPPPAAPRAPQVPMMDDGLDRAPLPEWDDLGPARPAKLADVAGMSRARWGICALLFFATTVNYMDRQVLGILAPHLQKEIGWTESQYGLLVASFTVAYAIGLLFAGTVIDRLGVRLSYAVALSSWSLAAMAHSLASTVTGLGATRFLLGLGESGNFPCALKAVAEWFPRKERAFATGIFNAGTNVGAIVAPLLVPWLALTYGWRSAFIAVGASGFLWLFFWLRNYDSPERHRGVNRAELAHIRSDAAESAAPVRWRELFGYRQTWAFALGKFMTDPIWWFYLYWLPKYLSRQYGVSLGKIGLPLVVIYVIADIGSVGGGWLSSRLISRGRSVNFGRKAALLVCALCVAPTVLAPRIAGATGMWAAVGFVALAAAAHQGWSCNLFTTVSDQFPRRAVASVAGIGGFFGAIGGMLFQIGTGYFLEWNGNDYTPIFIVCGSAYIVALALMHRIVPTLEPVRLAGG